MWGSLLLTALGSAGVLMGSAHLAPVALVGVGSMAALIGVALRFFPAAMAVSVTGIALSCASLMTVLGVTSGFEAEVVRSVAKFNGHILLPSSPRLRLPPTGYPQVAGGILLP